MVKIDGSKNTGQKRRVEIDGSKWTGQNRWVQIDRSKYTGPKDGFKKLGHTYRSKKTGPNRGVQIQTEMSPKLKCP